MKAACILPVMVTVVGFITTIVWALAIFAFQTVCFQRPAVKNEWKKHTYVYTFCSKINKCEQKKSEINKKHQRLKSHRQLPKHLFFSDAINSY